MCWSVQTSGLLQGVIIFGRYSVIVHTSEDSALLMEHGRAICLTRRAGMIIENVLPFLLPTEKV